MAEMQVAIVSVAGPVWEGEAKSVVVKTLEGTMGLLAGHEPVLAILQDSPVKVVLNDDSELIFAVHGGFFSMDSNVVNVLAERAESAADIDVEAAKAAKAEAEAGDLEDPKVAAALRAADTQLRVVEESKN